MDISPTQGFRAAEHLRDALLRQRASRLFELPQQTCRLAELAGRFSVSRRKIHRSLQRSMLGAIPRLRRRLSNDMRDLGYELESAKRNCLREPPPVPSLRTLTEELDQLEQEFGEWTYETSSMELVASTESIQLDDVDLGPFEIRLMLRDLADLPANSPYRVVAIEPNPAAPDSNVVHPHVSHEVLCAGDAASAINDALEAGRLCDFFLIIRSTLQTYNPDSPYVDLNNWQGHPCDDCGHVMGEDDSCWCDHCDRSYCDGCMRTCAGCDVFRCHACLNNCPACDECICESCVESCLRCDDTGCNQCLEDGLCTDCHQFEETENEEEIVAAR